MSMTEDEVSRFIQEIFGVTFPKSYLMNPSPSIIQQITTLFLSELGLENIHQPDLKATQNISNLERYENWLRLGNLSKCINHVLESCGCRDTFSTGDLLAPKRKKTLRILSLMIGLWYKQTGVTEKWKEFSAACEEKEQLKMQLNAKNQELQRDCEKKLLYLQQNRAGTDRQKEKLQAVHGILVQKKRDGDNLSEEYRGHKQQMVKGREELSQVELKISREKEEISQLESRIVRSPEKILAETKSKEHDLDSRRQEKIKHQKEYMEVMKQLDMVQGASLDLKPTNETLKETFDVLNSLRDKCASIADMNDKLKVKQNKLQQLDVICDQTEANQKIFEDQQRRARIQFNMKIKPLIEMNEGIKSEIEKKQEATGGPSKTQQLLLEKERGLMQHLDQIRNNRNNFSSRLSQCIQDSSSAVQNFKTQLQKTLQ